MSHRKILLIEDEQTEAERTQLLLSCRDYIVFWAKTSKEADRLWHQEKQRLCLLLVNATFEEEHGGIDLAAKFRSEGIPISVVYMSRFSVDFFSGISMIERTNFLQKPFKPEQLLHIVYRHCG